MIWKTEYSKIRNNSFPRLDLNKFLHNWLWYRNSFYDRDTIKYCSTSFDGPQDGIMGQAGR